MTPFARPCASRVTSRAMACVTMVSFPVCIAGARRTLVLEKFARDSKILDIFEGTQQIQQLIVARRVLDKSSSELK